MPSEAEESGASGCGRRVSLNRKQMTLQPDGSYRIPFIIHADAFASETDAEVVARAEVGVDDAVRFMGRISRVA